MARSGDRVRRHVRLRDVLLLGVGAAVLLAAAMFRLTENEAYPAGVELADRFDDVFAGVRAGELVLGSSPRPVAPGVTGSVVALSSGSEHAVLTGEAAGECYAHHWDADGVRRARVLDDDLPCSPAPVVLSQRRIHYLRLGATEPDPTSPYDWGVVLPDPLRLRYWHVPALAVGAAIVLTATARMALVAFAGADVLER